MQLYYVEKSYQFPANFSSNVTVLSEREASSRFAPKSFRPKSFRPQVVSPQVVYRTLQHFVTTFCNYVLIFTSLFLAVLIEFFLNSCLVKKKLFHNFVFNPKLLYVTCPHWRYGGFKRGTQSNERTYVNIIIQS